MQVEAVYNNGQLLNRARDEEPGNALEQEGAIERFCQSDPIPQESPLD